MAMTLQAIYDTMSLHLLMQGVQSRKSSLRGCLYRNESQRDGIGILLDDESYEKYHVEGFSPTSMRVRNALVASGVLSEQVKVGDPSWTLIIAITDMHDTIKPDGWGDYLLELAQEFGANPRAIKTCLRSLETEAAAFQ